MFSCTLVLATRWLGNVSIYFSVWLWSGGSACPSRPATTSLSPSISLRLSQHWLFAVSKLTTYFHYFSLQPTERNYLLQKTTASTEAKLAVTDKSRLCVEEEGEMLPWIWWSLQQTQAARQGGSSGTPDGRLAQHRGCKEFVWRIKL